MFNVTKYDDGNIYITDGYYGISIWPTVPDQVSWKYEINIDPVVLYKIFPEIEPYKLSDGRQVLCDSARELLNEVLWWMRRLSVKESSAVHRKVKAFLRQ